MILQLLVFLFLFPQLKTIGSLHKVYYQLYQRLMASVLGERKRFNYNLNPAHIARNNQSQKKLQLTSILSNSTCPTIKEQNIPVSIAAESREQSKRIEELELINKKIIDDTTMQFKKLESDVQRVERILEEKEGEIVELHHQSNVLNETLDQSNEEKKILIEAILQKDLVIKQYEAKLKEFLHQREIEQVPSVAPIQAELEEKSIQTDPVLQLFSKSVQDDDSSRNLQLQDELFEVKQELFDAQNKIKLISQQFQAYKLLKQIESIQEI